MAKVPTIEIGRNEVVDQEKTERRKKECGREEGERKGGEGNVRE